MTFICKAHLASKPESKTYLGRHRVSTSVQNTTSTLSEMSVQFTKAHNANCALDHLVSQNCNLKATEVVKNSEPQTCQEGQD